MILTDTGSPPVAPVKTPLPRFTSTAWPTVRRWKWYDKKQYYNNTIAMQ